MHDNYRIVIIQASIMALVFLQFHPSEAFMTNQNSSLVVGQSSFTTMTNTPINSSSFNNPIGLAFDSAGNLWVADSGNNRVLNYSSSSFGINRPNATTVLGQSSFTAGGFSTTATTLRAASALTFDSSGNLWVADEDNSRILEYAPPFTAGQASSLVLGQSSFTTGGTGTNTTTINTPDALAFDSSGNLWVSDQGNNRILEYTPPFTKGQAASLVLGHSSFTQASPGTNTTALNNPISVIFDSSGNLWVSDQNNNRILRYSPPFVNNTAANLVIGQTSFTTGTAGTSTSMLNNPANIAFDSSGNLWVADDGNNRILEYKYPFSNGTSASLVLGQANFTSNGINNGFSNPSASSLNDVNGIAFDKSGNLWVADSGNNRVLRHVQASQNQVLVGNSVTTITVNSATPQLIVANANADLSTIKIPSTVTDMTINYSNILVKKSTGNSVTLSNALGINANTTTGNFQITFPKNITINGSRSWSGTVHAATVSSVPSLPQGSLPAISIQVGLGSTQLTLSKAAELVFAGNAGKKVGFTYGGPFTEIIQVCSVDAATGIPPGATECKIDVGTDLHVWTLHFTTFSVYTTPSGSHGGSAPGAPPSFTTGFSASETPLSINGTGFKLNGHINTGTTVTLHTGKPFVLKMLLYGSQGTSDVQHVAIFTNLRDNARELQNSDTVISWDKNQPLSISDPHHYFGNVTVSTTPSGDKLELDYTMTFANPMAKSDIVIRSWSSNLYSSDTYVLDAWQAVANNTASPTIPSALQSITPQSIPTTITTPQNAITPQQASSSGILSAIKDWGGYSSHPITDSELLKSMNINDTTYIPSWVAKTAKWVADGSTSPQEFQAAISYLYQVHAIK